MGDLPLGGPRRAVAIGTFDGVHLGHQEVVRRAIALANERGVPAMALTFEPNPVAVLRPELRPTVLTELSLKARLIERLGVDELLVVPFNRAFSRIRAERFAEMLTAAPIGADAAVVGENFRFGHGGAGTAKMLRQFGKTHGLTVEVPEIVNSPDGKPVSSTRVRRLVAQGHVAGVAPLLGRPHAVEGFVVPGDHRGRGLGFATANLEVSPDAAVPARGVYACLATLAARSSAAAVNVGTSPTFPGSEGRATRVEAYLLDHDGSDLYGEAMRLEFLERLRDEERFPSPQALAAQMHEDVARTRQIAGRLAAAT